MSFQRRIPCSRARAAGDICNWCRRSRKIYADSALFCTDFFVGFSAQYIPCWLWHAWCVAAYDWLLLTGARWMRYVRAKNAPIVAIFFGCNSTPSRAPAYLFELIGLYGVSWRCAGDMVALPTGSSVVTLAVIWASGVIALCICNFLRTLQRQQFGNLSVSSWRQVEITGRVGVYIFQQVSVYNRCNGLLKKTCLKDCKSVIAVIS